MRAFTSIAYTEGIQPRIARIARMQNVEAHVHEPLLPIRVIRAIRG